MNQNYLHLIYLIRAALGEKISPSKLKNADFPLLYQLSKSHEISNLVFYGIENLNLKLDDSLHQLWAQSKEQFLIKDIMQQEECKVLMEHFNKNQISYVLLKGIILKDLYPSTDMRTMGDIDILINQQNREKVKTIMEDLGYTTITFKKNNEDIYQKLPVHNVEIHTELFEKKSLYYHYYKNPWKHLTLKENSTTEYLFSKEDFYIFLIAHFAKHYFHVGAGLRNIIDIYLYQKEYAPTLNQEYIKQNLKELELDQFETDLLSLIDIWFHDKKITPELLEMTNFIFESGTYGKQENFYYNQMKKYKNKRSYLLHRTFLPIKEMKNHYPILNKCIFLIPLFWFYRIIITILKSPKRMITELKNIIKK